MLRLDLLDGARSDFQRRLQQVESEDWMLPTPCPDWSVRDLVNHVVGGNWRYVALLHGAAGDAVRPSHDEDVLGSDPLEAFINGADAVDAAFREPGAMDRVVHHRSGDMPAERLFVLRVADSAIHGWDLAKAVNGDLTIDEAVVGWLNAMLPALIPALVRAGFYSSAPTVLPSGAAQQARLLHLVGREP